MTGEEVKPGRSEESVPVDEQVRSTDLVRRQFEELAPKRPLKPARSEEGIDIPTPTDQGSIHDIAEYAKFQELEAHTQHILNDHAPYESEEFVETDYYKDLNAVDKTLHHTTGTGFIKMETEGATDLHLSPTGIVRTHSQCNPATNDWIPSPDSIITAFVKPGRSDP